MRPAFRESGHAAKLRPMMRPLGSVALLACLAIALTDCGARVSVHSIAAMERLPADCRPVMIRPPASAPGDARLLGDGRFGDTGFSVRCDERMGLEMLRRRACGLGADAIRIVRDKRPDFVSTCYRATVEFYRLGKTRPPEPVEILVDRPEMRL